MRIGITEQGDAGLDLSWLEKSKGVDGLILVTKNVTRPQFKEALTQLKKPFVLHCTCTGMGGTEWEPNVPSPEEQIIALKRLIDEGVVNYRNVVIRIDPINPAELGYFLDAIKTVQRIFPHNWKQFRYRISVMDYYPHVRERLKGLKLPYCESFQASDVIFRLIGRFLETYPEILFESCAEPKLAARNLIHSGCVGWEDIRRMGLNEDDVNESVNPQNRHGCMCLSCKTELLTHKQQCPHRCAYCYWNK